MPSNIGAKGDYTDTILTVHAVRERSIQVERPNGTYTWIGRSCLRADSDHRIQELWTSRIPMPIQMQLHVFSWLIEREGMDK